MERPELRPTPLPPEDAIVDDASDASFPASDPPSYPAVTSSGRQPTGDDADVVPDTSGPTELA